MGLGAHGHVDNSSLQLRRVPQPIGLLQPAVEAAAAARTAARGQAAAVVAPPPVLPAPAAPSAPRSPRAGPAGPPCQLVALPLQRRQPPPSRLRELLRTVEALLEPEDLLL